MIQIVGSDIGGTLTDRQGGISQFTKRVLDALPVPVCLVTGYNRHVAFQYRDVFSRKELYLIAQNGAFAYRGDELLFSSLVDPDLVADMVSFLTEGGAVARVFCVDNRVYCVRPNGYHDQVLRWDSPIYRFHDGPLGDLPPVIQVCAFEPLVRIGALIPSATKRFGAGCIIGSRLYGTHQWLELSHPVARKETSFPKLLDMLGIDPANAMFCGDNFNDADLLKRVGHPVVVGDAPAEIRSMVHTVTRPGFEDGIAHHLNDVFALGLKYGTV